MSIRSLVFAGVVVLIAAPAGAQPYGRHHPRSPGPPDSTLTLTGAWQAWAHVNLGQLASPEAVRKRYQPSFDMALGGERHFADRVALRARADYHLMPSQRATFVDDTGNLFTLSSGPTGWMLLGLGGAAVRPWKRLWIGGSGGIGYFSSGLSDAETHDPVTGAPLPIPGRSGSGPAWSADARYEFKPVPRTRLLVEGRFVTMERGSTTLRAWTFGVGFRFR